MSLSNYSASIDTFSIHSDTTDETILASHVNKLQDCVVAIESELDTHKALNITAHNGIVADYDGDFLALVQKNYKNVLITYSYGTNGLLNGVSITGSNLVATISYTYSSGLLNAEIVYLKNPTTYAIIKTITTIYTYTNGLLTSETRTVS